uniref:Uncharacterized protein n=1 Tax=Leptobrachium leishanense TaxID=445787 RepID=A0A8C5M6E9_9ANUR
MLKLLHQSHLEITVKKLWTKAPDKHLALLDHRTTPLDSVGFSPAQLLMDRRPRNCLPTARLLLAPAAYDPVNVKRRPDRNKCIQKSYYDRKRQEGTGSERGRASHAPPRH